jgi:CHAT domain-containing protein
LPEYSGHRVARRKARVIQALAAVTAVCLPVALSAQQQSPLEGISFRIGSSTSLCRAQEDITGRAGSTVFDRSWRIICKDAARPIGQLHLLRTMADGGELPAHARLEQLTCQSTDSTDIAGLGPAQLRRCQSDVSGARWNSYIVQQSGRYYVAEGVAAYDDALRLGLRSIATNRLIDADPALPMQDSGGGSSYYRMEAAQLSAALRLEEGYRSNNSGAFARAVEYFDPANLALDSDVQASSRDQKLITHDMLVNRALQLSNLGQIEEAETVFAQARGMGLTDIVQSRLARNLEALHRINTGDLAAASALLARATPSAAPTITQTDGSLTIDEELANSLSLPSRSSSRAFSIAARLSPSERATVLDAQARQISGTIARLSGNPAEALRAYDEAEKQAASIREGRVTATYRVRSQIMTEKAMAMEQLGRTSEAEALLRRALQLLASEYPDTVATHSATAALAAFLARNGRTADALESYRSLVNSLSAKRMQLVGLENRIAPYFDLLTAGDTSVPERVADLFQVSQRVMRPGAASTVEQLSLQFQAGDSESAALYRQSIDLRREIERLLIQIAQLASVSGSDQAALDEVAKLRANVNELSVQQVAALDKLASDPKFRALTARDVTMAEMVQALKPGEAYLKLSEIGGSIYAVFLSAQGQRAYKLPISGAALQSKVQQLRNSVMVTINGTEVTYPFDLEAARALYQHLFAPVQELLGGVQHLIFEPDGGMLQLPVNLLVMDDASVERYHARVAADPDQEYDFTGVNWLGRERGISTALSAASFLELRKLQQSRASRSYLGLGQNLPVGNLALRTNGTRSTSSGTDPAAAQRCDWPAATWNNPIADTELRQITSLFGAGRADLMTGAGFNDRAVLGRKDLRDFRILHFATHGLLAPPAPGCPARPALLTSIAADGSDGMLEFREIFDLQLDADLVILSACDTAAQASREATREAGIDTGGGSALDGLVRAFIGAGSRTVIASHWPAPDSYQATERLMTGLFNAGSGINLGDALRRSQLSLMDDPDTSHPFYWAGFALVGDGAQQAPSAH